jgi:diacylglycerol kinase
MKYLPISLLITYITLFFMAIDNITVLGFMTGGSLLLLMAYLYNTAVEKKDKKKRAARVKRLNKILD